MKFKIPDQDTVCKAVSRVMLRNQRIGSQRELSDLVQKELSSEDPEYRISGERIRKVAVSYGAAKVEIEYREAVKKKLPDICPVCGNAMSPIMNMTLEGDVTEVKRNCTVCPFTAGQKACSPGRYIFVRTPPHEVPEEEIRIRKLRKAASHLRAAEKLISEALEGTNFPDRGAIATDKISEILRSKDAAWSIPNLEADIRDIGHEDPLWTNPLGSPKYPTRK